jgi:2-amino-4-hydroxy-6-hydroxymethyldihydropteridine diphosphokinase
VLTFIALGANLGVDPAANLDDAVRRLKETPGLSPRRRAPIYRSPPLGPPGQPEYANSVLEADTDLAPTRLLDALLAVEDAMGRIRAERWGPRIIDLDLLLYGSTEIDDPRLRVPHPEMIHRRFVLKPLADLAPDVVVPGTGRSVRAHLLALSGPDDLVPIDPRVVVLSTCDAP